jgi:hypothetical protein
MTDKGFLSFAAEKTSRKKRNLAAAKVRKPLSVKPESVQRLPDFACDFQRGTLAFKRSNGFF